MRLRVDFQILNLLVHALTLLGRAQTHSPVGVAQAQLGLRRHSWGCAGTVGVNTDPIGFSTGLILAKVDPLLLTCDLFLRMQVLLMKPARTL